MGRRKLGKLGYILVGLVSLFYLEPARAQQIHRNSFEGKQPYWLRGESNVKFDEKSHSITDANAHRGTNSEQIIISCEQGKNDDNFVQYYYKTPQAPVNDELAASVYVRGNRTGVQILARVVLPRERDPDNLAEPLTVLLPGDTLKQIRAWQRLDLPRPKKLLQDQQQKLRTQLKKDIDLTDAYIDRLILNLYAGPGTTEVQIDDLEISPVVAANVTAPPIGNEKSAGPALPLGTVSPPGAGLTHPLNAAALASRGQLVRFENGRLRADGQPIFPRIVRYAGGNLKTLKDSGFNAVYLEDGIDRRVADEALANGLFLVPQMPLLDDPQAKNQLTSNVKNPNGTATSTATEALTAALTKYGGGDGVLFYDLGPGRTFEQIARVSRTAEVIRASDPMRARSVDVWDGYRRYSTQVELIGMHRNPLMSSLELTNYRDFMLQRQKLAGDSVFTWSWVQTHAPDRYTKLVFNKDPNDLNEVFAPTPEQIRLLAYLGIASGSKGLGFWTDRFLNDPRQDKERLLMLSLLNAELAMLEPVLQSVRSAPQWVEVPSNSNVKMAILRGEKGILVLPMWLGNGTQNVAPQASVSDLTLVVPQIPDGMSAWEVTPSRVRMLAQYSKDVVGGTKIVVPEFDLVTPIVFTNDLNLDGLTARWQDHSMRVGRQTAEKTIELAEARLDKVRKQHASLEGVAPREPLADDLLQQAQDRIEAAHQALTIKHDERASMEATRAMRPLRILMRAEWETAVKSLDFATCSPYTATYQTLPMHWRLHQQLRDLGANALPNGDFEMTGGRIYRATSKDKAEDETQQLPTGWSIQQATLDAVDLDASLIPSARAFVPPPVKPKELRPEKYRASSTARIPEKSEYPRPELGNYCLRLAVNPSKIIKPDGKPAFAPSILERTFLAVHSPPVRLQPGTWVRVSGWIYIPQPIQGSADGFLFYDSAAGESMGLRMTGTTLGWKRFRMFRQVPESGVLWLTVCLTGMGQVFVDDLKIEPYINAPVAPAEKTAEK